MKYDTADVTAHADVAPCLVFFVLEHFYASVRSHYSTLSGAPELTRESNKIS
jgi:hypothetical protein